MITNKQILAAFKDAEGAIGEFVSNAKNKQIVFSFALEFPIARMFDRPRRFDVINLYLTIYVKASLLDDHMREEIVYILTEDNEWTYMEGESTKRKLLFRFEGGHNEH